MEEFIENFVKNNTDSMPIKHQFLKLMIGTAVGFAATKLSQKGYESVFKFFSERNGG